MLSGRCGENGVMVIPYIECLSVNKYAFLKHNETFVYTFT